ncbi:class I SAM-dependent methyltransferase [Nocardioides currus]|uniref:SAM-dependent methyltransferase n=1 Tax=Nocardioides currus TaxID=2133958 RepID=A0A2R7Z2A9_9ACTN|nr:class I SAM-dependent methyltransferase [Nocardioides currus]PUA82376.1 SAM-dependent methyltransferase [Nocardioides currus]
MQPHGENLRDLYARRFADEQEIRSDLWEVLCRHFFQQFVPKDAVVLDVAAGHCEFVNNIRAGRRIAVDLNPDVVLRAAPGVETHVCRSDEMTPLETGSVDRVFISNFFEHVPREVIVSTLDECRRVLRPDGRLMVLQPNVRYCGRDYWMFLDHITPVDDRALAEAFRATGFDVERSIPRFLPYTTKGRLPSGPGLVKLYLKVPLAWKVMGAQAFMIGRPA